MDDDWNTQPIIDLEWAHTLPLQMQRAPFWLTSRAVDQFHDDAAVAEYGAIEEYFGIYQEEEERRNSSTTQVSTQREMWRRGSFWYYYAVLIPKGMYTLFNRHIQPLYNRQHPRSTDVDEVVHWYWGLGMESFTKGKLEDKEEYLKNVQEQYFALK